MAETRPHAAIPMGSIVSETFVPMLHSLDRILELAEAQSSQAVDLVQARLADDMYTLGQQVQQACHYAGHGAAILAGRDPPRGVGSGETIAALRKQIAIAIAYVAAVPPSDFADSDDRDCSIDLHDGNIIQMDAARFLLGWTLPHFYFHVVTAYGIIRHSGIRIGKFDYLHQVGSFINPGRLG